MTAKTIDMTPTWSAMLPMMFAVLENPKASHESKEAIREEFARLARTVDAWNAEQRSTEEVGA